MLQKVSIATFVISSLLVAQENSHDANDGLNLMPTCSSFGPVTPPPALRLEPSPMASLRKTTTGIPPRGDDLNLDSMSLSASNLLNLSIDSCGLATITHQFDPSFHSVSFDCAPLQEVTLPGEPILDSICSHLINQGHRREAVALFESSLDNPDLTEQLTGVPIKEHHRNLFSPRVQKQMIREQNDFWLVKATSFLYALPRCSSEFTLDRMRLVRKGRAYAKESGWAPNSVNRFLQALQTAIAYHPDYLRAQGLPSLSSNDPFFGPLLEVQTTPSRRVRG